MLRRRGRNFQWLLVGLAILSSCCRPTVPAELTRKQLRLMFYDVGQGDASLLRTPEGQNILIDAGPGAHTAALLAADGISKLDLVILSHAHRDHTGGIAAILKRFDVAEVWYSGTDYDPRFEAALRSRVRLRTVKDGDQAQLGTLHLWVFHSTVVHTPGEDPVNDDSLVVKADFGKITALFPGDCELNCWEQMFRHHRPDLRADILKAAHHGSSNGTSSGVLVNVRPRIVIISCGRKNHYGHPDPIVLKLLDRLGAQTFRTDSMGTVRCANLVCTSERPGSLEKQ